MIPENKSEVSCFQKTGSSSQDLKKELLKQIFEDSRGEVTRGPKDLDLQSQKQYWKENFSLITFIFDWRGDILELFQIERRESHPVEAKDLRIPQLNPRM